MTSIEINGTNYPLKFGFGFMQGINKKYEAEAKEAGYTRDDSGLSLAMLKMIGDKSLVALIDIIMEAAKSTPENQLKRNDLIEWIENDDTDINGLFKEVESFFAKSNCCKLTLKAVTNQIAEIEAAIAAEAKAIAG